ncbi:DUF3576 domain-containing protein [Paracoccus aerodenitrificans]|nr:DUF3576 domain-containing protein [Paracoccus aerodenitrificans]WBU64040.1 DUF3576 domain-containing protein [Paracoccus aerodenitrificans]
MNRFALRSAATFALTMSLVACSRGIPPSDTMQQPNASSEMIADGVTEEGNSIWDLFSNRQSTNDTVAVNKYLWNSSLEVLNFLPIQSIDPFTGVIVTGYGTPPGGGRSYRATVHITDPALDARSLRLSLQGPGGSAVAPGTVRAVEDAILTRARQLRVADGKL